MFEAAKTAFNRFSAIRDQDVVMSTSMKMKSPQQIKREHMRTTIPMFADHLIKYKFFNRKRTSNADVDAGDATSENVFLIRNKSIDKLNMGKTYNAKTQPGGSTATSQSVNARNKSPYYEYDVKTSYIHHKDHVHDTSVSRLPTSTVAKHYRSHKKLGDILHAPTLDNRLYPVRSSHRLNPFINRSTQQIESYNI